MHFRIEALKAGVSLVHLLRFLLADVAFHVTPLSDTSHYEVALSFLPPKDMCDLSVLDVMYYCIEALRAGDSLAHLLMFLLVDVATK